MRIISKFSDYYDGIQGMDTNHNDIWLRKEKSWNPWELLDIAEFDMYSNKQNNQDKITDLFEPRRFFYQGLNLNNYSLEKHLIGFCGKIYPIIIAVGDTRLGAYPSYKRKKLAPDVVIRDYDSVIEFIETHKIKEKTYKFSFTKPVEFKKEMDDYFNGDHSFLTELFFKLNTPVFVLQRNLDSDNKDKQYDYEILESCSLKELHFQQVHDAYSTYQEITMFRDGVLGCTEQITEISDEDRIKQHGYHDYSFKTRPI